MLLWLSIRRILIWPTTQALLCPSISTLRRTSIIPHTAGLSPPVKDRFGPSMIRASTGFWLIVFQLVVLMQSLIEFIIVKPHIFVIYIWQLYIHLFNRTISCSEIMLLYHHRPTASLRCFLGHLVSQEIPRSGTSGLVDHHLINFDERSLLNVPQNTSVRPLRC